MRRFNAPEQLRILRERRVPAVVVFMLTLVVGTAVTFLIPPKFESRASIYISAQGQNGDVSQAYQGNLLSAQKIKSYVELVQGDRVQRDAEQLLGRTIPAGSISSSAQSNTVILDLASVDSSPEAASSNLDAVSRAFLSLIPVLDPPPRPGAPPPVVATAVQSATFEPEQASPNVAVYLAGTVVLALLLAVAAAQILNRVDNTIRTRDDVEAVGPYPYLGGLSSSKELAARLLVIDDRQRFAEELRYIRTGLEFSELGKRARQIVITSAEAGEGKTTLVCNMAQVLALAGWKVLLVDADLRRPRVAEYLGLDGSVGLTSVLIGKLPLARAYQKAGAGFAVLASGPIPPNPSEALGSQQMDKVLRDLDEFDFVLVDSPPVGTVTDASVIASKCDGTIFAARSGVTNRRALSSAIARIEYVSSKIYGVVITMEKKGHKDSPYYYYQANDQDRLSSAAGRADLDDTVNVQVARPTPRPRR